VVDIEQRALGAFKQDSGAAAALLVQEQPDSLAERQDAVGHRGEFLENGIKRDLRLAQAAPQRIVVGEQPVDLGGQCVEIGKVHDPNRPAADLVLVSRSDAAAGGADPGAGIGRRVLAQRVEFAVQRQDQRRIVGDAEIVAIDDHALGRQPVDFADQRMRINDDAIADHSQFSRPHNARGQQRELVDNPVDDQRVAGIVAALEADDDIGPLGQPVDDLALTLVAPLRSDDNYVGHDIPLESVSCSEAFKAKPAHAYRLEAPKSTLWRKDAAFLRDNFACSGQTGRMVIEIGPPLPRDRPLPALTPARAWPQNPGNSP